MSPSAYSYSMRGTSRSLDELRQAMVEEQIVRRGIHDERVVTAIAHVPRHEFVAEEYRNQASPVGYRRRPNNFPTLSRRRVARGSRHASF